MERRTHMLRVRVTGDEHRAIQAAAQAAGLSVSEWLRRVGSARDSRIAALRELRGELGRQGGLLKLALGSSHSVSELREALAAHSRVVAAVDEVLRDAR